MSNPHELVVSARDAEAIASVVGNPDIVARHESETTALTNVLMEARLVPHEKLPADRVSMNSRVTYREGDGATRTITVVHPSEADAARLRISVLSPVGRALLGRRPGSTARATVPGGRGLTLHVLRVEGALAREER